MTDPTRRVTITIEARHLRPLLDALQRGLSEIDYDESKTYLQACEAHREFANAITAALSNEGKDVKAQLVEACQQAYDLIAGGCYHASPVAHVLKAAIEDAKENT